MKNDFRENKIESFLEIDKRTHYNPDKMQTRSMTKKVEFSVDIDFDEASKAWRSNKISKGNCMYIYKCEKVLKTGEPCCQPAGFFSNFCKRHQSK